MGISNNYAPDKSLGNGVTVTFTGLWSPISADYFKVHLEAVATGVQTLVDPSDYTFSFTASGYSVTLDTAPSASYYVIRSREVEIDQTNPYRTAQGFQGPVIENSFDKLTAIAQDQQDEIERTLAFPLGSSESGSVGPIVDRGIAYWDDDTLKSDESSIDDILDAATAAAASASAAATSAGNAGTSASSAAASAAAAATFDPALYLPKSGNLAGLNNAGTARTNLGATSTGSALFTAADAAAARTAIGAGTAATQNTGTSGANIPLLNAVNTWGAQQSFPFGSSSGLIKPIGQFSADTGNFGNAAGVEQDMRSYTIPANAFGANGQGIEFYSYGTNTNNANAKTLRVYFGGTQIFSRSMTVSAANNWLIRGRVFRTGSGTQKYVIEYFRDGSFIADITEGTLAITDTAAITFKYTFQAAGVSDTLQKYSAVNAIN